MTKTALVAATALFLVACGDPRDAYVGSYSGRASLKLTDGSEVWTDAWDVESLTVREHPAPNRVYFGAGECAMTLTAKDGNNALVDPATCPKTRDDQGCDTAMAITGGTAVLSGANALRVVMEGRSTYWCDSGILSVDIQVIHDLTRKP
jgi:hypothetical protein